jgi:hypothetical protein
VRPAFELGLGEAHEVGLDLVNQLIELAFLPAGQAADQPADRLLAARDRERARVGLDQRRDRGTGEALERARHANPSNPTPA